MGLCRMTVPAAEKMTTKMIRITPVLMELSVSQIFRNAERSDRAITFVFLAEEECTFRANVESLPQAACNQLVEESCAAPPNAAAWAITLISARVCRDLTQAEIA